MFKRHPSTILRLNRKVTITGNVTDKNRSPKHIVTTKYQDQNIIRSHMTYRTETAVATASKIIENYGRRISAQTVRNRLKAVRLRARMLVHASPYLITIVEGWLWLDDILEPQVLGGPMLTKDSVNYRDEDT